MHEKISILFSFSFFLILDIYVFNNVIFLNLKLKNLTLRLSLA